MSNLERDPTETVCVVEPAEGVEVLEPREVPLGGPRALPVRRTLPQRSRSLVGAWCFADSYGPVDAGRPGTMDVPPHPHSGLQTVSWLYAGEIEHRDSVGSVEMIAPGQVNLMTAGSGIQHSEVSTGVAPTLHGVQLWIALPDSARRTAPLFEHHVPEPFRHGDAEIRVFVGELLGHRSAVTVFTELVGAQIDLPAHGRIGLSVDPAHEHGLLVDAGSPEFAGTPVPRDHLAVVPVGSSTLEVAAGDEPVRAVLLGGAPLGESIVMWWNFVGRSHDEIAEFRARWQADVIGGGTASGPFGRVDGYPGAALPAPELPNARLRPRG